MSKRNTLSCRRILGVASLVAILVGLSGADCTKDRTVEITVTVDLIAEFHAQGSDNTYSGSTVVDVSDQIDIQQIMDDNDIESIDDISIQSAFVKTVQSDPAPGRTISGSVDVQRGAGPVGTLVAYTSAAVNSPEYQDWHALPLEAAGTTILNGALDDIAHGLPATVAFTVGGTSTPIDVATDFIWQAKLRVNVVGTKTITIFEPL